jgi:hypothetical protein
VAKMKYSVAYKSLDEISRNYCLDKSKMNENYVVECVMIEDVKKFAKIITTNVPKFNSNSNYPLQQSIRCYIINDRDMISSLSTDKIFDRYG